jgi:acid phosphatase type 7
MTHKINMKESIFSSPPVIQHANNLGFTLSIKVNQLCTGYIFYGNSADNLDQKVQISKHGLIDMQDEALIISVSFPKPIQITDHVFYKVCAQTIVFKNAYTIERGIQEETSIRELNIPHTDREKVHLTVISDTHENTKVIHHLSKRVQELNPDMLIWNGDICRQLNEDNDPASIYLEPEQKSDDVSSGGWASTRPLLYNPGNHDVRGVKAQQVEKILPPDPITNQYYKAFRFGPLAIINLVSGEDKPDNHPVFGGTAAYENYREEQIEWLKIQMQNPELSNAPFKIVFTHIPLIGYENENDGLTHEGHAYYSGDCARKWLPTLIHNNIDIIFSGHKHEQRHILPNQDFPIHQMVGGGPEVDNTSLINIEADNTKVNITFEDGKGEIIYQYKLGE